MSTGMSEKREQLFLLFKNAIESEKKAQIMYKTALELIDDKDLKKVIEGFYQDEIRHERKLIEQYNLMTSQFINPEE